MKTQPGQTISSNGQQADPEQTAITISATQFSHIAELLDILDQFLRHADGIADHLSDYLHATGRDQPQLPNGFAYNANLLIDQVSFTAHSLREHSSQL